MNINVQFDKSIGKIKPVHAVGQPPFSGIDFSMFEYLKNASIPYSRLHDVGGAYGGGRWVDIPNIFRNFDADEYDPRSYDFAFTDLLITALVENGVEPYFRLGVTIENYAKVRAYNIYPPKDFKKWAVICEHVIMHYTEGWANGFKYDIKYWEIWNEPDNYEDPYENQMWRGAKEEYYELYDVTAKHLKSRFPHLKIGGYGSCGFYSILGSYVKDAISSPRLDYFITFLDGFIDYIKENGSPIDFFSWHSYDNVENNIRYAKYARERLDNAGISCEIHCNEWNNQISTRGTAHHAAVVCNMILAFQHMPVDMANFYDAQLGIGSYAALFNPLTRKPYPAYYAFLAFGELFRLGCEVECTVSDSALRVIAASNGNEGCIVIANPTEEFIPLNLNTDWHVTHTLVTSDAGCERETELPCEIEKNSVTVIYARR